MLVPLPSAARDRVRLPVSNRRNALPTLEPGRRFAKTVGHLWDKSGARFWLPERRISGKAAKRNEFGLIRGTSAFQ